MNNYHIWREETFYLCAWFLYAGSRWMNWLWDRCSGYNFLACAFLREKLMWLGCLIQMCTQCTLFACFLRKECPYQEFGFNWKKQTHKHKTLATSDTAIPDNPFLFSQVKKYNCWQWIMGHILIPMKYKSNELHRQFLG